MTSTKVEAFKKWHSSFMPNHEIIIKKRHAKGNLLKRGIIKETTPKKTIDELVKMELEKEEKNKRIRLEAEANEI